MMRLVQDGGHGREGLGPLVTTGRAKAGAGGCGQRARRAGVWVLTQASVGAGAGPGAAGRRAVSNTAPPRMRCH